MSYKRPVQTADRLLRLRNRRFIVLPAIGTLVFEPGLALLALGAVDTWL
jgi:hypothetical protein